MKRILAIVAVALAASPACGQTNDPFPEPIEATDDIVAVDFVEFAVLPDIGGEPARMMLLVTEPGTERIFVNDMRGPLYTVSYDGRQVREYVDINDARWGVSVEAASRERGFQSFALHPQFGEEGTPGYGKFYTWTDTNNTAPTPDFRPASSDAVHHTVLLEWTARNPGAATYDGEAPRELMRFQQPYGNHNAGHLTFNPTAEPGDDDYGLLYMGVADGGSGGDPLNHGQDLSSGFGKIFRFDPLGSNSANGKYGIPAANPFVSDGDEGTLGEIYALGVRNPQRFGWDPETGAMYMSDIGQNIVEEISPVTRGANLGWNTWEGSFRFISRSEVDPSNPRGDPSMTYPVAEYDQTDPLLQPSCCAATGVYVYRDGEIDQLEDLLLFGDFPSGEIFYVSADDLPEGGQDPIRRVLLRDDGEAKTVLEVIREKNVSQGREPANRADMRFGMGPDNQLLILNKQDGTIRLLVP
jgi:Glucose / Sorbosone dehydrogenase